jgi:hypothetical protein
MINKFKSWLQPRLVQLLVWLLGWVLNWDIDTE